MGQPHATCRPRSAPRGPVATGQPVCYVALHRLRGMAEDVHLAPRDKRDALAFLCGAHVATEESGCPAYAWDDWYAVPIAPGRTVQEVARYLAGKGIHDGPYHGALTGFTGREIRGSGAGTLKPGQRPAARRTAARKAEEKTGNSAELLQRVFGGRAAVWLATVRRQEMVAYPLPTDWDASMVKEWHRLNKMESLFHAVYCCVRQHIVDMQRLLLEGRPCNMGHLAWWTESERIIGEWVREALSPKPKDGPGKRHRVRPEAPEPPYHPPAARWRLQLPTSLTSRDDRCLSPRCTTDVLLVPAPKEKKDPDGVAGMNWVGR